MIRRWRLAVLLLVGLLVSGCSLTFQFVGDDDDATADHPDDDAWVMVVFETRNSSAAELMAALESTECRAAEGLELAGLGTIDGNDVGEDGYELYFVGTDAAAMWKVLEPIFARAPASWDRVELLKGLKDPRPTVIRR